MTTRSLFRASLLTLLVALVSCSDATVVNVADLLVFAFLTAAGLALRSRPEIHKRLMLLGTIGGLMWPAITRMPVVAVGCR
jgi:hypothetical protein